MTYLFYGKEKYLIDEEIKKYKDQYDEINIVNIKQLEELADSLLK